MADFVVTGASGFIGRALCARLAEAGARVAAVSRDPGFRFPDRRVSALSWEELGKAKGAVCVHLAANNNLADLELRSSACRKEALKHARNILDARFARVVFASSAAVYGETSDRPHAETSRAKPASAYGRLKLELEAAFAGGAIARLSNVYGPGMSPANVFSHILGQLQIGDAVLMRNLTSVRDYLFIADAVEALEALARSRENGVFNVATGKGTRVDELVSLLAKRMGRRVRMTQELEAPAKSVVVLDPSKLRRALGWRPKTPLGKGLDQLLDHRS